MAEEKVIDIEELAQDTHNFNRGNEQGQQLMERSFKELGAGRSILLDRNGNIIAGNKSQKAAIAAGIKKVRVIETTGDELVAVKRTDVDIDTAEGRKMAFLDNLTTQVNLTWDETEIQAVQADVEGFDVGDFGVSIDQLPGNPFDVKEPTGETTQTEQPQAEEDDFDPDEVHETKVKTGDVWLLGEHRLMCGDSTDAECVAKLMNGERADIAFTSPPYNMAQGGSFGGFVKDYDTVVYNNYKDNLKDSEYGKLLVSAATNCLNNADDVLFNIGIVSGSKQGIIALLSGMAKNFCDILCWKKSNAIPCGLPAERGCITHFGEMIYCFNQKGTRAFSHTGDNWTNISNIVETQNASGNEFAKIHKATFPVEFAGEIVSKFSEKSVLDCFGGTGTTLIAAEQLGRKCYMMELDPHYCTVIIARWEKLTGQKAVKLNP